MPRIRTIKPEFFHNEELSSCSPHARLLAIALLQLADCEGRLKNIPMQIHAHAFPWESEVNTLSLLGELERVSFVIQYEIQGKKYICIPKFLEHQRLQGKEAQAGSKLPPYDPESLIKSSVDETGSKREYPSASQGMTGIGKGSRKKEEEKEEEEEEDKTLVELKPDDATDVFKFWQITMSHPRAAYDSKRKALIKKSLKNYSKEDLMKAIHGCSVTPHNMGDNERGEIYDSIELILREAKQIDRFMRNSDNPPTGKIKTIEQTQSQSSAQAERIRNKMRVNSNERH